MKSRLLTTLLLIFVFSIATQAQNSLWTNAETSVTQSYTNGRVFSMPDHYRMVQLNQAVAGKLQSQAPLENLQGQKDKSPVIIDIPLPGGSTLKASLTESPIFNRNLPQYSGIKTYRLTDPANGNSLGRITINSDGITGLIFTENGSVYLSPLGKTFPGSHIVYFVKDAKVNGTVNCGVKDELGSMTNNNRVMAGDCHKRTYRLAVAATGEYTTWAGSQANAISSITTTVNDVIAIYERDAAISFTLVTNNNIVFPDPTIDPYPTSATTNTTIINDNQTTLDGVIGSGNYDLGIVFNDGWDGGLAALSAVCNVANKGRASAGLSFGTGSNPTPGPQGPVFDGTVAHEMGHLFSATHSYSATNGACGGQVSAPSAWEPGGGSTLMAYTNVCTGNFYQAGSDLYFHGGNILQIESYATGTGNACAVNTALANNPPTVTVPAASYTIPISTPFTLTSTGSDIDNNSLTYVWEEMDAGTSAAAPSAAATTGPNFRPYPPSSSSSRTFPRIQDLASGTATPYEVLPSVARTMNFQVMVRDNAGGGGCTAQTSVTVTTNASAGPFTVTSQSTSTTWTANGTNTATITWNVANTTAAPVSCPSVDILLSTDGGLTYPYTLVSNTPNDGTQAVTIPSLPTSVGRVKVQAHNNIFFNINSANITITSSCSASGASFAPTSNVTGGAGSPTLDLSLSPAYGNIVTISGQLANTDPSSSLAVNNITAGTCINFNGNLYQYDTYRFTPSVTGTYTFTIVSNNGTVFNLYNNTFDPNNPCSNYVMSNGTYNGSSVGLSSNYSVSLTAGLFYTMAVGTFASGTPALPSNYTINVTPPGGGNIYNATPPPGAGFNYTYIIVDNATGNIKAIDPNSDLSNGTTYPIGTYTIYGLSYSNAVSLATLNSYVGGPLTTLQNDLLYNPGAICGNASSNQVLVTVTSVLPIQLLPLQAYKLNSNVLLKWSASNDQQLDHFEVLHSTDGVNFSKLPTIVPPQNSNASIIGYNYTDQSPAPNENYYRIAAYDKDGSSVLSNVVRVNMGQSFTSASVYPNPANTSITVEYISDKRLMVAAQVLDTKGAVVGRLQFMAVPGRNNIQYNIAGLAKGSYAIQLVNNEETIVTRFVKE